MASKATTIQYIIDRIFQNSSKLVTGTKAQEAVIKVVQESVNQDAYNSDQITLNSRIEDVENETADNTSDIQTNTSNIATNANAITALAGRVTELESGGMVKVSQEDINSVTEIPLTTGDFITNIFIKVQSYSAGATIQLQKKVSNPDGLSSEDDYFEEITPLLAVSSSFLVPNVSFGVLPNYGESDAFDPAIAIIATNCTVTLIFNRIPNFI